MSQPFHFDIINQLANIPARITLYELLKLSKPTREALREALADAEVFVTQLPIGSTIDEPHSLSISCVPTFEPLVVRRVPLSGEGSEDGVLAGDHPRRVSRERAR